MIAYKLTDRNGFTRKGETGETFWKVGATVSPTGKGSKPCGPGVLHAYGHPLIAVLFDIRHANYGDTARLFEIEAESWETDGCKRWTTGDCRVLRELELPKLALEERVATAIILSPHPITRKWAIRWLSGEDRTEESALGAAGAAWAVARAAKTAADPKSFESRIPSAIERARKILAKEIPAERAWDEFA